MDSQIIEVLSQFKVLYAGLGVLTLGVSFGGAWAIVRFGVSRNAVDIVRLHGDVNTLYTRTNEHHADLSRLDERSKAIDNKLEMIHNEVKRRK